MKVTHVALRPTEAAANAHAPALTPELLAATGARYSRNNEGLEAILSKIDPQNLDKSVDGIFRMIDYGHQSIADMAPVALFMDGLSLWLAYYVWTLCPTAGGQESSTRYLRLSEDSLADPAFIGLAEEQREEWLVSMGQCFAAYAAATHAWEALAAQHPEATRIPPEVLADTSEKGQRKLDRMRRNYAFDRSRYYLPAAAKTNVMLIMSARGWVQLSQFLLSHVLPETQELGLLVREQLQLSAPRLMKHATAKETHQDSLRRAFAEARHLAACDLPAAPAHGPWETPPHAYLEIMAPAYTDGQTFSHDLDFHENRYAPFGQGLQRTMVRFGWDAVTFAELRDLNRHRTGTKYCPFVPIGFYGALDQIPSYCPEAIAGELHQAAGTGIALTRRARALLEAGDPAYVYWTVLGTQFHFEHTTTADKFLYEAELRTGVGAHYRYARHLHDALAHWYRLYPETKGKILEGSAEPE